MYDDADKQEEQFVELVYGNDKKLSCLNNQGEIEIMSDGLKTGV